MAILMAQKRRNAAKDFECRNYAQHGSALPRKVKPLMVGKFCRGNYRNGETYDTDLYTAMIWPRHNKPGRRPR
ncbi:hypothetical protein J4727_17385 [Providencia rettgeri]|uniref:Uncharacterized protein n=1 Tax=Providencia rettgeri TaxID=587 RepID=A0A939SPH9_PRORE|nr:hypothetical protein [Providencia rettgeri]